MQWWVDPNHLAITAFPRCAPSLYRELAAPHGLVVGHIGHLGGLDPVIIKPGRVGSRFVMLVEGRYPRLKVADRINHGWLSSYPLAVLRRPD
jgi:hypothetical protein